MEKIFSILKEGLLNKILQKNIKELEAYLRGKKSGGKYLPEKHVIEALVSNISNLLTGLRFALLFVGKNWRSFEVASSTVDRIAIPTDFLDLKKLKQLKEFLSHFIGTHIDREMKERLSSFSDVEIARLDEALVTLRYRAYFSSIVMSVSAVESRLHTIIKKEKPVLYKKGGLGSFPLGQLFSVVNSDRKYSSIKKKLPQKYFSLINLCNSYRIFSAHPKEELMNYQDAISVFGLTISFLVEPRRGGLE